MPQLRAGDSHIRGRSRDQFNSEIDSSGAAERETKKLFPSYFRTIQYTNAIKQLYIANVEQQPRGRPRRTAPGLNRAGACVPHAGSNRPGQ